MENRCRWWQQPVSQTYWTAHVWHLHTTTHAQIEKILKQYSYTLYSCCLIFHPCLLVNCTLRQLAALAVVEWYWSFRDTRCHQLTSHISHSVVSEWYPAGGDWLSQVRLQLGHCGVQCGQRDRQTDRQRTTFQINTDQNPLSVNSNWLQVTACNLSPYLPVFLLGSLDQCLPLQCRTHFNLKNYPIDLIEATWIIKK